MKDIKYLVLIVALCVVIVFLFMDKCGSSRKLDNLKGQYEEASKIAKVERIIKEEVIKEQKEKIIEAESTIATLNENVAKKDNNIAELGNTVADLEEEFSSLTDKDAKIQNLTKQVEVWKKKFSLARDVIMNQDEIIFLLTKKYNAQLKISNSYKSMYETLTLNTKKLEKIVTVQDRQIKILKLTSGVKTGIGLGLLGVVIYGVLK